MNGGCGVHLLLELSAGATGTCHGNPNAGNRWCWQPEVRLPPLIAIRELHWHMVASCTSVESCVVLQYARLTASQWNEIWNQPKPQIVFLLPSLVHPPAGESFCPFGLVVLTAVVPDQSCEEPPAVACHLQNLQSLQCHWCQHEIGIARPSTTMVCHSSGLSH